MSAAIVHIDGASRGNPGPSAFAFILAPPGQTAIEEHGLLRDTTNNIAEYTALVKALEKAAELSLRDLHIHSDSELLVKQMNGEYRVKNPDLQKLYDEAQTLLRRFSTVRIGHIRREQNKRADQLCNIALDADKPKATTKPKKPATKAKVNSESVREDCVLCLQAARNSWAANDIKSPTPGQVWEQLWSILEERGVLASRKA